MLRAALPLLAVVVLAAAGCPGAPAESCGQSTTPPTEDDVARGRGKATRSDGVALDAEGSWSVAQSDVVVGTLVMQMPVDETGATVTDLIADGAFPICVPMGERSETSGAANLLPGFVTNANTRGGLAVLAKDGDTLFGRFAFDMQDQQGNSLAIDDGVFIVDLRD